MRFSNVESKMMQQAKNPDPKPTTVPAPKLNHDTIRYDTHRSSGQGPLSFLSCALPRPDSECAVIHTVIIGHAGCAQVELGYTEIFMDAIQSAYSVRNEKKGRRAGGDGIVNATSKLSYRNYDICLQPTYCVVLVTIELVCHWHARWVLGRPRGPLARFVSDVCFFVPTVRRAVPQALLCSPDVAFFDGQHKHKHAGTGAGRQEHAATRSPGRLDQEPGSTRQNGRTKVSL
jgi:hypothetical protein